MLMTRRHKWYCAGQRSPGTIRALWIAGILDALSRLKLRNAFALPWYLRVRRVDRCAE
jgi:hypothetical protein